MANRDDKEIQYDSQGNSVAAKKEHSPDGVQFKKVGSLDQTRRMRTDGAALDRNKSKGKVERANRPDSSSKKAKKWTWTPEAVELLLKDVKPYKTKCEFNGINFEFSDLRSFAGRGG